MHISYAHCLVLPKQLILSKMLEKSVHVLKKKQFNFICNFQNDQLFLNRAHRSVRVTEGTVSHFSKNIAYSYSNINTVKVIGVCDSFIFFFYVLRVLQDKITCA